MSKRDEVIAQVEPLLAAEPALRWAYLFGSCARDAVAPRDVDVAVMPREGAYPTAVDWGMLIATLEAAAGMPVDLVDLRTAPLPLAGTLLEDRVVLLDREPGARHVWEADTTSRWIDFRPAYERYTRVRQMAMSERLDRERGRKGDG
ncbi:MAG: nucleotidyltransferase domain-containing protein [Planctomycetes bacterium]|nr:nucleotidyltransferase domain-containing protein [Planctomycetota bacterium]